MFDYFPAVGGNSLAEGFIIIIIMGDIINTQIIPLSQIVGNRGQLKGLPKNPRVIKDDKFAKLVASIREQPDMLYLRELLVYPFKDKYIVIGGNMRHKAMKELGVADAPCKVIPAGTPVDKLCQILLKDNSSYGEWDTQALAFDFDEGLVTDCGLDFADGSYEEQVSKKKKGWHVGKNGRSERRCNLEERFNFHVKMETSFHASFNVSPEGYLLFEIKENFDNVPIFAQTGLKLIRQMGIYNLEGYAIVAAPKRRHKNRNFADCVCEELSKCLGIPYRANVFTALNNDRTHPKFSMLPIKEKNVIFYDDILTTGSTMLCCYRMLKEGGLCNVLNLIGINNT